jgi:hypothetical protein
LHVGLGVGIGIVAVNLEGTFCHGVLACLVRFELEAAHG